MVKEATFEEIVDAFCDFNRKNGISYGDVGAKRITAVIVYKQSNFTAPYTEQERSYRISNLCGKAFFPTSSGSRSMVGDCLDGKDVGVRLDRYGWAIERCYFEEVAQ